MLENGGRAGVLVALIQRLQPDADFAGRNIGLLQQLAHGEEAVELRGLKPAATDIPKSLPSASHFRRRQI